MKDKVSSEGFIKAFGNGAKDNREITQISDEVSSETDILISLREVENDIKMREAYEAGYEKAKTELNERPQSEWIPVSERLPEKTGYYLVTRKGFSIKNHVKRVGYDANTKRWSEGSIIAWQPLPEPYKEGGEEE